MLLQIYGRKKMAKYKNILLPSNRKKSLLKSSDHIFRRRSKLHFFYIFFLAEKFFFFLDENSKIRWRIRKIDFRTFQNFEFFSKNLSISAETFEENKIYFLKTLLRPGTIER